MSDAGDDIQVDAPAEVEVSATAPKGKLSVEEALKVPIRCSPYPELFFEHIGLYSKS
jgi:hypothetical protein